MTPEQDEKLVAAALGVARQQALRESLELGTFVSPDEHLGEAWLGARRASGSWRPGRLRFSTWAAIGARCALADERAKLARRPTVRLLEPPAVLDRPVAEERDELLAALRRAAPALTPGRLEALASWLSGERNIDGAARVGRKREAFWRQRRDALAALRTSA